MPESVLDQLCASLLIAASKIKPDISQRSRWFPGQKFFGRGMDPPHLNGPQAGDCRLDGPRGFDLDKDDGAGFPKNQVNLAG